ncbi:TPA: hypothetical protein N0F65_008869 [Lagenidium giganteum]|uniref:6,7-dimethyl-8-ribityllumazine synthase n=1 Tax=Lagenidium giganteum TaxID=4803 RepID=A0AAV2YJ20_9STRA|nr:TPA: hypothetical protein N0F65_008869 [Lagenidium giganteum]
MASAMANGKSKSTALTWWRASSWVVRTWRFRWLALVMAAMVGMRVAEFAIGKLRTRMMYWEVSPSALWHVASQFEEPRGIVLPLFDENAALGLSLIQELRLMDVHLPIEVPHCGDLSTEYRELLLEDNPDVRVYDVCQEAADAVDPVSSRKLFCANLGHCHSLFRSFNIKVISLIFSRFAEVMLLDADTMFFQSPMPLWDTAKYQSSGTLFFHDRVLYPERQLGKRTWLSPVFSQMQNFFNGFDVRPFRDFAIVPRKASTRTSAVPMPELPFAPSDFLLTSHTWNLRSGHQMDSSLMLWSKARQQRATTMLASFVAMTGRSLPPSYGDKEFYFLACEMSETLYAFSDYAVGSIGTDVRNHTTTLCGDAIHFFPVKDPQAANDTGVPLYINSDKILEWNPTKHPLYRTMSRDQFFHNGAPKARGLVFNCLFEATIARLNEYELSAFRRRQLLHQQELVWNAQKHIILYYHYYSPPMADVDKFSYPEYYDFPPFFTLQPVRATREKQLVLWKQLILEYHRTHSLPLFQPFTSPLFENVKISRKMDADGRAAVVEFLIRCGNGSWEDDTHTRCRIMWKKPSEWAAEIYDFAREHGMIGNVFTVYELYAGEETQGSSIHGMEPWLLREALRVLESEGKPHASRHHVAQPVLVEEPGAVAVPRLDGKALHVGLIYTRECAEVVEALVTACRGELLLKGVVRDNLHELQVSVPFELPYATKRLLESCPHKLDAVVVVGCLVKGVSASYEFVGEAVTRASMKIGMKHKTPVVYGVLICRDVAQARECAGLGEGKSRSCSHGVEWAQTAIEMAHFNRKVHAKIMERCRCDCHTGKSKHTAQTSTPSRQATESSTSGSAECKQCREKNCGSQRHDKASEHSLTQLQGILPGGAQHGTAALNIMASPATREGSSAHAPGVPQPVLIERPGHTQSRKLDGHGLRVAIVSTRWYGQTVVHPLVDACVKELLAKGVESDHVHRIEVAGAYELPFAASRVIQAKKDMLDAVVCIGCNVQGGTMAFEFVSEAVVMGIMKLNVKTDTPVVLGVLTCLSEVEAKACAEARGSCGGSNKRCNHGVEWAQSALEMAHLKRSTAAKRCGCACHCLQENCKCTCHRKACKCTACSCSGPCKCSNCGGPASRQSTQACGRCGNPNCSCAECQCATKPSGQKDCTCVRCGPREASCADCGNKQRECVCPSTDTKAMMASMATMSM